MTDKLSYEEWEKEFLKTQCVPNIEEEIEKFKTQYYCGLNTYEEFKRLLKDEYERYLNDKSEPPDQLAQGHLK